jgi:hypothetical protein
MEPCAFQRRCRSAPELVDTFEALLQVGLHPSRVLGLTQDLQHLVCATTASIRFSSADTAAMSFNVVVVGLPLDRKKKRGNAILFTSR